MRARRAIATALLGLAALGASDQRAGTGQEPTRDEPRASMDEIYAALNALLPRAFAGGKALGDPEARAQVEAALDILASGASRLATHGRARDAGFEARSAVLAADAREARRRFQADRHEAAAQLLRRSLRNCVACHSRMPSAREFPVGRDLLAAIEAQPLDDRERARVAVATRQFAEALSTYERLFQDPGERPRSFEARGDLLHYLEVALAVEGDAPRAGSALTRLAERRDTDAPLRADLETWLASLDELRRNPREGPPLGRARALLDAGDGASRESPESPPRPARGRVYYVEAWHELHRFLDASREPSLDVAEACYRLGWLEARAWPHAELQSAGPYLEAAVRMAPREPWARDSFGLLEELVVRGYTGSGGTRVPPDEQARLDALRELLERETP